MKKNCLWWSTFLLCLLYFPVTAQEIQTLDVPVQITHAEKIGTTIPLRHLVPMRPGNQEKKKTVKKNKKAPSNFAGRGKYVSTNPNALPQGPDPTWQKSFNRTGGGPVEPLVNVDGVSNGFLHDPTGDIGRSHYLQAINATTIGVFDKQGNLVGSPFAANTIWNSIGFSSAGDPIILYDQEVDRWIITEFPPGNQLLVAISEDSDPMGSWTAYNFATPNFPDYPKYSVWNNSYVVTTNEQGPGTSPAYFINRQDLLAGASTVMIQRLEIPGSPAGPGFQVDTPVDWSGLIPPHADAHPMILSMVDDAWGGGEDKIDIYSIILDWDNPANTMVNVQALPTSPFDSNPCSVAGPGFSCMPQAGNGGGLDGIPETIMHQAHYRNFETHESLVLNFITDVSGGQNLSGIRWMEIRRNSGETDWSIYQEGTFAPDDGLDRYMGGIAMDGAGNIALAYNVSSEDEFVGVRFTGRRASDPLGEMTVTEVIAVEGTNTVSSGSRFGDYAHMSVDPTNDRTFWYTTEYGGGGGNDSATRILAYELRKDTTDIGPSALLTPQSASLLSTEEEVTIEVKNFGLDTQSVFQVGYIFEGGTPVVEPVNFTLFPDSSYIHTFGPRVDMSTIGDYDFRIFTSLDGDQAILNDTLRAVVSHIPRFDVGVTNVGNVSSFTCVDSTVASIEISNFGTATITELILTVSLNGEVVETINWTGNLEQGDSEVVELEITGFAEGENELVITTSEPNGFDDEIPANDGRTTTFTATVNGSSVFLVLTLDNFPEETTWQVNDEDGNTLFEGGPYSDAASTVTVEWCLDPEACYVFAIQDSYGDGICCSNFAGEGNYQIQDADGAILAASNGQFGAGEEIDFCATLVCNVAANITVANESGDGFNGAIFIGPQGGLPPYSFSIDGGETFQSGALFQGITGGEYEVIVQDANGCEYTETVTVTSCVIEIIAEITNISEAGATDGIINISLNGGVPPYQYSIDGGSTFQDSPQFNDLGEGTYEIVITDANDCEVDETIEIGMLTSTANLSVGYHIEVFPNPTDGLFRINVSGLERESVFLGVQVFNAQGQLIQERTLARYDGVYTAPISLLAYPSGTYFVQFRDESIKRLIKVVRK